MIITYMELSSLTRDLGFSARALYAAANHKESHYHKTKIPKGNGEMRELTVPDGFMKAIQRRIVEVLLCREEISPYAKAYRYGTSTRENAAPHLKSEILLKLDIRQFFDHIIYPIIKEKVFPADRYSEANRVLLSLLCIHKDVLPQGAPTSPVISNIIMKDFDNTVGEMCRKKGINYTRYCDDMTFSGRDFDPGEIIELVKNELGKMGLYLNGKKTVIARRGQKQTVTGIVVNEKMNVSADYRKKLRQELYYCIKYGVSEHLKRCELDVGEAEYLRTLLGRTNYVLSVDLKNQEMQKYKKWLAEQLKKI